MHARSGIAGKVCGHSRQREQGRHSRLSKLFRLSKLSKLSEHSTDSRPGASVALWRSTK